MNRKSVLSLSIMALAAWLFMFSATSVQAATSNNKKDVKTTVKIRTTTQIGSTTLSPGKYSVKIAPASDGRSDPTVQFSIVSNTYGDELAPYQEEVVLTVQASITELAAPATTTEMILSSSDGNKAIALKIRGKNTEYVFDAKTASAATNQ